MKSRILFVAAIVLALCSCNGTTTAAANPKPTYVPAFCANVSPAPVAPTTPTAPAGDNPTISTEVQLRVIDSMVAQIDQVYLYPDFQGVDWSTIARDYRRKIEAGVDTATFYDDMVKLVNALGDNHSRFESPAVAKASDASLAGTNDYVGIGVSVLPLPERGRVSILSLFPGSPAERSGVKIHDNILAVDGQPIVKSGVAKPMLLRGPRCSVAVLTIQSPGKAARRIAVVRDKVTTPEPIEAQLLHTADGSRIGYIYLPTFFDKQITPQVDQALRDFGQLDGLILDDRMNTGGSFSVLEPVLSHFTSGTVGHFVSRTTERAFELKGRPFGNSETVPLVVLTSKHTESFAEIFAGILQDVGRAKVVGDTTAGNVETLHALTFDDGSRAWIAEERFESEVSRSVWEKTGIVPDLKAPAEWDTFTFDTDRAVAAALQVLTHK